MMDKPLSMSVKNYLIRKMATDMIISEKVIGAVVDHQFSMALDATTKYKSIELSGFGKLWFNQKRAEKAMVKMLSQKAAWEKVLADPATSPQRRRNMETRLSIVKLKIADLKPKLHEDL